MAQNSGFSKEERDAMKERAKELRASKSKNRLADQLAELKAKISEMDPEEAKMATGLHELVMAVAPDLEPKTWYGMPAWAKDGKVICFFQSASKFKTRYATFGFSEWAMLDDGVMWPASFALLELNAETTKEITRLVKKAVS
jgi:uncharacterized protein YdhG (YjbR/CyaY superfamily)